MNARRIISSTSGEDHVGLHLRDGRHMLQSGPVHVRLELTRSSMMPTDGENMKIGIIGAGQIGGTLTRRVTALGHEVFVANSRGPETLSALAAETGASAVSVREAVHGVDLVVLTIPLKSVASLSADLFSDTPRPRCPSSIPATTIPASATAALKRSRRGCPKAGGSSSSLAGR